MEFILKRGHLFSILLITIVGIMIYANSLYGEFQFDDEMHIVHQNKLNELSFYSEFSSWTRINDRPLAYFTLALNKSLNGANVFGYHLLNLMVHLLTSILVYFFTLLLLSQKIVHPIKIIGKEKLIALFVALIFLCHPIQTQAVSYIIQRMTSLAALFYIASCFFYLKARLSQVKGDLNIKFISFYLLTIITAIASVLSKQIAVTLPLSFLLIEFFFVRNNEGKRFNKFLLIGVIAILISFFVVIIGGLLPRETESISRYEYFITQLRVMVKYVQLLVLPISQNLDYDFVISKSLWGIDELISGVVVISLLASVFTLYRKYPLISFGIAWFFITLLVESSIIPISDVIFEHRLYLPMFGFSIVFVAAVHDFFKRYKLKYVNQFIVLILITFCFATYARNEVWKNKYTMWKDVVSKSPDKARPHVNLGIAYIQLLKPDLAIRQFNIAKKLEPGKWDRYSYFNLGDAYLGMSQPILAIEQFDQAQSEHENWEIFFKRAEANLLLNKNEEALNDLNKAILLNNSSAQVYEARGRVHMKMQNFKEAINDFSEAIRIDQDLITVWFNRSNAKLFAGDMNGSLADLNQTILLDTNFAAAYNNRGQIKYNLKDYQGAISDLDKAIEIEPDLVASYCIRAKVFLMIDDFDKAIADINKSLLIIPDNGDIFKLRGEYFLKINQITLAYDDFIKAKSMGAEVDDEILTTCREKLEDKN